jgi:hypothetical protein
MGMPPFKFSFRFGLIRVLTRCSIEHAHLPANKNGLQGYFLKTQQFGDHKVIVDSIRSRIQLNDIIPKPETQSEFIVKGWGKRRNQDALIYKIPNHSAPLRPYEKGVTQNEFEAAYAEIMASGHITRKWFNANLPACAKEGACNFTTIGGIFVLLGVAQHSKRGQYTRI